MRVQGCQEKAFISMKARFQLKGLAVAAALVCSAASWAAQSPLSIDLQAEGENVTFSVTNTGDQAVTVLRWDTPLEAILSSDVFEIADGEINYNGRHIKRHEPLDTDFVRLAPGETVSASLALNQYYEIVDHASYQVSFDGSISYTVAAGKQLSSAVAKVAAMQSVDLTSSTVAVDLAPAPPVAALAASEQLTIAARDALINLPVAERASSPRYTQWFGAYTAARYSEVQGGMSNAVDVMANQVIDFNCDCDEGAFAYVFTNDPFKIYLCRAFWTASVTGTDSQAGTILHELSHFPEVKGTDDHAYGQSAAAALARSNPAQAANNADSFEYFVENTPDIAMQGDGTGTGGGGVTPVTDTFITLTPGTSVNGTVAEGASVLYHSNGASAINLTTIDGDADLVVYSDEGRINEVCSSNSVAALDSCDLGAEQNTYIEVYGYEASSFTLATVGTPVVTPQIDNEGGTGGTAGSGGGGGGAFWFGMLALMLAGGRRGLNRHSSGSNQ